MGREGNGGRGRDEGLMFVLQGVLVKNRDDQCSLVKSLYDI